MKNSKIIFPALFILGFMTSSFAQDAAANFVPKNPVADNLLTSENTVLLLIDWQQDLINVVQNIDQDIMMNNVHGIVKTATLFGIPVIETTIGVKMAGSEPTVESVKSLVNAEVEKKY